MTKVEKVNHERMLRRISDLEKQLHELNCIAGDYVDNAQELARCIRAGEQPSLWAILNIVNTYKKQRAQIEGA